MSDLVTPQNGDIFWAKLPSSESVGSEQEGERPVLVVSTNLVNDALRESGCVIIPLSQRVEKANRNFRIRILEAHRVAEPNAQQLKGDSVALTEQIRFISRDRMSDKRIARVTPLAVGAVEGGIKFVLGIP